VTAIVEDKQATPQQRAIGEANSGIYCFRDAWLWPALASLEQHPGGELYLTDLVEMAREQKERVEAVSTADALEAIGPNDRVAMSRAEAEVRRRINEGWMLAGVTFVDPSATYVDAEVQIDADTVLWPGTYLQGTTRIGRQCTIGPGAVIRDSTIGDRCRVVLSVLEGACMEQGSDVGPYSHLRKGARVQAGAHVGNFCEIKNSVLGPGAKMGHVSYLGDATVGANANIGAGTITCNYDGERKAPTVIGPGAFIGSDTLLVAPVTVGEGAKTGAGSVVTHDLPPHSVAYGVPARVRPAPEAEKAEET
jgi:bifunctional UDP-N-acetylglucosamine pyrophosphorylase/glucosamine-1-phosphate N-acetyltransferase